MTKDQAEFDISDFLNGLFMGSMLGAAYVYFFHHPQGKKIFAKYWSEKDKIWQEVKKELEAEEKKVSSKAGNRNKSLKTEAKISYWQKRVETGLRFFNKKHPPRSAS